MLVRYTSETPPTIGELPPNMEILDNVRELYIFFTNAWKQTYIIEDQVNELLDLRQTSMVMLHMTAPTSNVHVYLPSYLICGRDRDNPHVP